MTYSSLTKIACLSVVATCLSAFPSYADQLISGSKPSDILDVAKGFGSAELTKDSEGDPKIVGRIDGTKYAVYFYGCSNGANCTNVVFTSSWSGYSVSLDDVNKWNMTKKFGRAFLDSDRDPNIDMAVNLRSGVTKGNLEATFSWWQTAVKEFRKNVLKE